MIYTVTYTSWAGISFNQYMNQFRQAWRAYDTVSMTSKINPKRILDISVSNNNKLQIVFESTNQLATGREANALWYFSHYLVEQQGFTVFVNSNGKLLKSA